MTASKSRIRPVRGCLLFLFAVLLILLAAAAWMRHQLQPVGPGPSQIVRISRGTEIRALAKRLRRANLIRHAGVFYWYTRWRGDAQRIRAGRYRLSPQMTPSDILDKLVLGKQDLEGLVTIPEGFTAARIADRLQREGVVADKAAFLRVVRRPSGRVRMPFKHPPTGLEGYLFPSSYDFEPKTPPHRVAQVMVNEFVRQFAEPYADEIAKSPHSLHELVTIASLIEREAAVDRDRPLIAGVIENRLRKGMRLQIDATVIYALGRHVTRVLYKHLETPSPYNTYLHAGLPPGPIASPGLPSLLAALRPARHDYLFYVAGPDGAHIFTRTLEEHNKAVARMRALRSSKGS